MIPLHIYMHTTPGIQLINCTKYIWEFISVLHCHANNNSSAANEKLVKCGKECDYSIAFWEGKWYYQMQMRRVVHNYFFFKETICLVKTSGLWDDFAPFCSASCPPFPPHYSIAGDQYPQKPEQKLRLAFCFMYLLSCCALKSASPDWL